MESIAEAIKSDLACEIIYTAMNELKKNPEMSIETAIDIGVYEWTK